MDMGFVQTRGDIATCQVFNLGIRVFGRVNLLIVIDSGEAAVFDHQGHANADDWACRIDYRGVT
jgi:hypothetical protein